MARRVRDLSEDYQRVEYRDRRNRARSRCRSDTSSRSASSQANSRKRSGNPSRQRERKRRAAEPYDERDNEDTEMSSSIDDKNNRNEQQRDGKRANSHAFSGPDADCDPSSGGSPSLQPPTSSASLVPHDDKSISPRSSSPARDRLGRSSSNASDHRDYILDLADPKRTASNGAKGPRQQKHRATFECTLCPKRFTRAYNLRSHLRTHTDERPFVCTVCGKAFARQLERKRHERLHHSQSAGHLPENTNSDLGNDENVARDGEDPPKPSGVMALPAEDIASSDGDEPFIFQQDDILPTLSPGFDFDSIPPLGHDGSHCSVPVGSDWDRMITERMSIPPPPRSPMEDSPLTSATYVPGGESFGPGVGIPPLPDQHGMPSPANYNAQPATASHAYSARRAIPTIYSYNSPTPSKECTQPSQPVISARYTSDMPSSFPGEPLRSRMTSDSGSSSESSNSEEERHGHARHQRRCERELVQQKRSHLEDIQPTDTDSTILPGDLRPSRTLRLGRLDSASTDLAPEKPTGGSDAVNEDSAVADDDASDVRGDGDVTSDVPGVQALLNRWLNSSASALLLKDDGIVT